ncbi:hypothetical protein [Granulicella sp. L60]|uniref:hypothetical protein n=1 Tax=Granulicella sp. L60 TaxID=1641866 RepID=UPI00131DFA1D|nr:hypothetical protein [Granulicella sp. L60]
MTYHQIIDRRRALRIGNYATLADVNFNGPWVTPYQISSRSLTDPVLIAYNWFDVPSVNANREILKRFGYMPDILFNKVIDGALQIASMNRSDIYVTQAFHLLPTKRSGKISASDVDISFDAVTRHELADRRVISLGGDAYRACCRHGIKHIAVAHPSARGRTIRAKAECLAQAIVNATR